jgi:hypothetical protein
MRQEHIALANLQPTTTVRNYWYVLRARHHAKHVMVLNSVTRAYQHTCLNQLKVTVTNHVREAMEIIKIVYAQFGIM